MSEILVKRFKSQDVFFNNGIVNIYNVLKKGNINGCQYCLSDKELVLTMKGDQEDRIYHFLFENLIKENNIVYLTPNDRLYWYKEKNTFRIDKRFDVAGKASPNDVKYIFDYISAKDLNISTEELFSLYQLFSEENKIKPKDKSEHEKYFKDNVTGLLKEDDRVKIPIYMTFDKAISNFTKYLVKGDSFTFDSKIHQFEDGGYCFKDMLSKKNESIGKWEALIFWYGSRIGRFYNSNYFIYLNSMDMSVLQKFKDQIDIPSSKIKIKDQDSEKIVEINTNVDFIKLSRDGIKNKYFYSSSSQQEFQLKFFMYLFSNIYHIEDDYENKIKEDWRKKKKEDLYNGIKRITFLTYTEDGPLKSSLAEYTRGERLFQLFKIITEVRNYNNESNLFKYLSDIITITKTSKRDKVENLNINKLCDNLLSFRLLRSNHYETCFDLLKNDRRGFGNDLALFESIYLKFIGRSELEMSLHAMSKKLGDEIGYFVAEVKEEKLLYTLRNIKNYKQLVGFIKDLKFVTMKYSSEDRFTKEFNKILSDIMQELESNQSNWELVRDYISIYAINKYKSTLYAKSIKEDK